MTRGILVIGNASTLSTAIVAEALKRVQSVATAIVPGEGPAVIKESKTSSPVPKNGEIPLHWNPVSPVSARSLVVAAENRLGSIDEAIVLCTPSGLRKRLVELTVSDIDSLVDRQFKSWFYLIRELDNYFRQRKSGIFSLVCTDYSVTGTPEEVPDLFTPAFTAGIRTFIQSLIQSSGTSSYRTLGFLSTEADDEAGFAAYILKTLDEAPSSKRETNRLYKYGKLSLFNR